MAADPKLVVALEARLDKFEKQMAQAGVIADQGVKQIEERFSQANPVFTGSFLGSLIGQLTSHVVRAGIDAIQALVQRFIDLEHVAKLASIAMNDLFGLQQAAKQLGGDVDETTKSVRSLAVLLDQMQRGEQNSLSRLFDANPAALQGLNREALTFQQTLEIVADLVRNARTEIQKIDLAKAAGQAESMVPLLEKGGAHLRAMQKAAADTAPDLQAIANAAKQFDEAWKTAVDNVKAYIVGSFVEAVKTEILKMIDLVIKFLSLFEGGLISGVAEAAAAKWKAAREAIEQFGVSAKKVASEGGSGNIPGGGTTTRNPNAPLSTVPTSSAGGAEGKDAFERQIDTINKHISRMDADAEAVGKTAAEHERLRVEADLLSAAQRAGIPITDEMQDKIQDLADTAAEAAEKLARNKLAFSEFLSGAKEFSSGVSEAFKGMALEGKKLDEVLKNLFKRLASSAIDKLFQLLFLGHGGTGTGGIFGALFGSFGKNAAGTNNWRGGLTWVGEKGPELLNIPRGAQIIPNDVARKGAAAGNVVNNVIHLAGEVSQASIDRVEMMLQRTNRRIGEVQGAMVRTERFQRTGVG